jgi:hypothetical protein
MIEGDALPTRESFELAMRLCKKQTCTLEDLKAQTAAAKELMQAMLDVDAYARLVDSIHTAFDHAEIFRTCPAKIQALASVMSQMFMYGWAAGRQEVIDCEVAKIGGGDVAGR